MLSRQNVPINFRQIQGTILFRSSRPCGADLGTTFCSLGIKSVCDLRSEIEVDDDTGLDNNFSSFCLGLDGKGGITESQVRPKCPDSTSKDSCEREGRHLFISLISTGRIFFRAPWHIKIRLVFAFLWDSLFGTKHTFRILLSKFIGGQGDHCLLFLYKIIVEDSGSQICATLKLLSQPERVPALICCSMGKDRTGVICALVGHVCGRSKEEIAEDYALSQECYEKEPSHDLLQELQDLQMPSEFKDSPYSVMMDLLQYIDEKYGSVDAYLDEIGFNQEDREALRKNVKCVV